MKAVLFALFAITAGTAHAGKVTNTPTIKGINEAVTISAVSSSTWGYTYPASGDYSGTAVNTLVPVTREAAAVLQALDKSSKYNCVIENSTFVKTGNITATYFVLDMNCN